MTVEKRRAEATAPIVRPAIAPSSQKLRFSCSVRAKQEAEPHVDERIQGDVAGVREGGVGNRIHLGDDEREVGVSDGEAGNAEPYGEPGAAVGRTHERAGETERRRRELERGVERDIEHLAQATVVEPEPDHAGVERQERRQEDPDGTWADEGRRTPHSQSRSPQIAPLQYQRKTALLISPFRGSRTKGGPSG